MYPEKQGHVTGYKVHTLPQKARDYNIVLQDRRYFLTQPGQKKHFYLGSWKNDRDWY